MTTPLEQEVIDLRTAYRLAIKALDEALLTKLNKCRDSLALRPHNCSHSLREDFEWILSKDPVDVIRIGWYCPICRSRNLYKSDYDWLSEEEFKKKI